MIKNSNLRIRNTGFDMNSIIFIHVNITRSMMSLDLKNLVFVINESKKIVLAEYFAIPVPVFSNYFFLLQTMDRFDDPKSKGIYVPQTD
jgi:hypothetical protein